MDIRNFSQATAFKTYLPQELGKFTQQVIKLEMLQNPGAKRNPSPYQFCPKFARHR